jgi:hypothetical protein
MIPLLYAQAFLKSRVVGLAPLYWLSLLLLLPKYLIRTANPWRYVGYAAWGQEAPDYAGPWGWGLRLRDAGVMTLVSGGDHHHQEEQEEEEGKQQQQRSSSSSSSRYGYGPCTIMPSLMILLPLRG